MVGVMTMVCVYAYRICVESINQFKASISCADSTHRTNSKQQKKKSKRS